MFLLTYMAFGADLRVQSRRMNHRKTSVLVFAAKALVLCSKILYLCRSRKTKTRFCIESGFRRYYLLFMYFLIPSGVLG